MPRRLSRRRALARREASIRRLARLVASDRPIIAGPWLGDVGMELLYWIPFLRWLTAEGGVDPARVTAVSRGGADAWYAEVAGRYVDLLDLYEPAQIERWERERLEHPSTHSRIRMHKLDRKVFKHLRYRKAVWLHPVLMYRLFAPRWVWGASAAVIASHTEHAPLPEEETTARLPESYIAVTASFNPSFPDTPENRAALQGIISSLADQSQIVLVRADGFELDPGVSVLDVTDRLEPRTSLTTQSSIVQNAEAFVAPYGGISYLGPYVGTSTLAIYSQAGFEIAHLDAIDRIGRRLGDEGSRLYRARHVGSIRLGQQAAV